MFQWLLVKRLQVLDVSSHRLSLLIITHSWGLTEAKYSYLRFLSYKCSSLTLSNGFVSRVAGHLKNHQAVCKMVVKDFVN